jgi:hypothetical protein
MDLIALGALFVSSIGLGLAGSRAILSGVFCLVMQPIGGNHVVNVQPLGKVDHEAHTISLAAPAAQLGSLQRMAAPHVPRRTDRQSL